MQDYTVLWEKSVKHDLKSVGRKAAEHIRETVETTLAHDPRQGKQLQGDFKPPLWSYSNRGISRTVHVYRNRVDYLGRKSRTSKRGLPETLISCCRSRSFAPTSS